MGQMEIVTAQPNYQRVFHSSPSGTFTAVSATTTKPTTRIIYDSTVVGGTGAGWQGNLSPSLIKLVPYANNTDLTSTGIRLIGWSGYQTSSTAATLIGRTVWIPTVLAEFTLGYTTGTVPTYSIEGANDARPFSSAVQVYGTPVANVSSPASPLSTNTEWASIIVDPLGSQLVEVQFRTATGSRTMAALWYAF
jgi:hypothetical protein